MLKLYEINPNYIDYLCNFAPHLFHNKKAGQTNDRKYIGVVLKIDNLDYYIPLSSFKQKHINMKDSIDFIKLKRLAVLNINNMFPADISQATYIDISKIKNEKYKNLLLEEYRIIKLNQSKIVKNAEIVYKYKTQSNKNDALSKRCNDFKLLEQKAKEFCKRLQHI